MIDFPWIKSYPAGVRWDADLPLMPVAQLLDEAVTQWPKSPAVDFMGRCITYVELGCLVDQAAAGLQEIGVGPGVHVGLYLPNTPHYPIAFFAVMKAGGIVVNYSPLDAERVLEHKVEDSQTDVLITLDLASLYPNVSRLLGQSRLKKLIVGTLGEFSRDPDGVKQQLQAANQFAVVDRASASIMTFSQLLSNAAPVKPHVGGDPKDSIAVIQYTGGTTGFPKGAMLTQANLTAACAQYFETTQGSPPVLKAGQERALVVIPLFHIYSLTVNMLLCVRLGAEMVLHARFELDAVVNDLAGKKITMFAGVPTMYVAIINHPRAGDLDLRSLKFCGSGGAPLPTEVGDRFKALTGCPLNEGWGMTETSPTGTFTPLRGLRKSGSCGLPLPRVQLVLRDLDDPSRDVAAGAPGELCIKGPNVMKGYWRNDAATRESFTADGYFRSGDVARIDDDGFFYIVDRTKDMLLCGGFNVYPRVIEEAIYEHPSVEEVCVIGIDDPYRGQSPKAFIKLKNGAPALSLDELKRFLGSRLGKHEMLHSMEVRELLPKTAVGKLSKKDLIDEETARRAVSA